ncbi:MAG: hypothetical protein U9N87_02095 [Planctomycetota bacterium]|nr:hypothetical protein [Planctomycetota bacterium]
MCKKLNGKGPEQPRRAWKYLPAMAVAACFLVAAYGCGNNGREAIEGTVTFDGQPLAAGQISFLPMAGTKGPTAGAAIKDGAFKIASEGGTFAGKFRVEVTATRPSNRKVMDPESGQMVNVPQQFIPAIYNRQSQLTADVKSGEDNSFPFELKSR